MGAFSSYETIIAVAAVIIFSYIFTTISKRTNIPSVLLLIILGVAINRGLESLNDMKLGDDLFSLLEILGIVGLIMIVLEAALDLELTKEKRPLIIKSFFVALVGLLGSIAAIAYTLNFFLIPDLFTALVYAVPLSIMSSAIIIPSVASLSHSKKEFMIYESTFSDILGIMFFYFLIGNAETQNTQAIILDIVVNISVTILLSVVVSYALVLLFQKLESDVKLFLLIAVLILMYSIGKKFHLSSLVVILIFGLVLNNYKLFFKGRLEKWINESTFKQVLKDFHVVTLESAFVVRTFFFVIFGMTLDLSALLDLEVAMISLSIILSLYVVRFICLKIFGVKSIFPELFVAPRGLITILLFFSIPDEYIFVEFNSGILLFTILASSLIMTFGLITNKDQGEEVDELNFPDWEELDKEIKTTTDM